MDKNNPKKVVHIEEDFYSYDHGDNIDNQPSMTVKTPRCPDCKIRVKYEFNFCPNCSRRLDWGTEKTIVRGKVNNE